MKTQVLLSYSLIVFCLLSFGCTKDAEDVANSDVTTKSGGVLVASSTQKLQQIAVLTKQFLANPDAVLEVKKGVEVSLSYGLDESFRLRDILSPQNSKFKRQTTASQFSTTLKSKLIEAETSNGMDLLDFAMNNNVEIYWPYSENWDGVEMPTITFNPGTDQLSNEGYKYSSGVLQQIVIVDEEYAINHPVWIITIDQTDYSLYPNFASRKFRIAGTNYWSTEIIYKRYEDFDDPNVYTVSLGSFMSEKQHDVWWNGGSDYVIQFGSPVNMIPRSEYDLTISHPEIAYFRISRTRKQIRNKEWVDVNIPLIGNWAKPINFCGLMIHEDDGGDEKKAEFDLGVTIADKFYGIKLLMPFKVRDRMITRNVYDRKYIFSTNNHLPDGSWTVQYSDGVYWNIKYKIGQQLN